MLRMIPVLILVVFIASACGSQPEPELPTLMPSANPLCSDVVEGDPMPLSFDGAGEIARNCYSVAAGAAFTVSYLDPDAAFARVNFSSNCPVVAEETPPEGCTAAVDDTDAADGFSAEFTAPEGFEYLLVTAFAYDGEDTPVTGAGPVVVVIEAAE
ncbi:MAG: hypothetical protein AAFR56_07090 [Chloroflexota bacterium]